MTSLREKLEWLASYGVDRVHVCRFDYRFAQTSPDDFIERIIARGLGARWVLVGDDFRFGARRAGNLVMLKQAAPRLGFEVAALASFMLDGERVSSTALREALAKGELERAGRLLGVQMVGRWVTEQLGMAYLSVNWEATPEEIGQFIQPHPTLSETFGETVLALTGRGLHL